MALRLWGLAAGPVQAALVVALLTPEAQGSWYAISGLQRFQAMFELGAGATLAAAVARQPDRAGGWLRWGFGWYAGMAAAWLLVAGPVGAWWLRAEVDGAAAQIWLWTAAVTAAGLPVMPLLTALESSQQVAAASWLRAAQGVAGRLTGWGALWGGAGSGAQAVERAVAAGIGWGWIGWLLAGGAGGAGSASAGSAGSAGSASAVARGLLAAAGAAGGGGLSWRREILPLQWRIALATVGGALPFAAMIPLAIQQAGRVEGGRLGVALTVLGGGQGVAWALMAPAFPAAGRALAAGDRAGAARRFARAGAVAVGLLALGAAGVIGAVWGAGALGAAGGERWAGRMTGVEVTALLGAAFVVRFVRDLYAAWCRADLRPVTWLADLVEGGAVVAVWGAPVVIGGAGWDLRGICQVFLAGAVGNLGLSLLLGAGGRRGGRAETGGAETGGAGDV